MSLTDWIILITELVGTIAFAVSGSLTAIERRLDFFGILVLAIFTAVGGGLIRDLILGNTPPVMFRNPLYVLVAFASSVLLILFSPFFLRTHYSKKMNLVMHGINIFDAVGLGIFTLTGMNTAFSMGYDSAFLAVFVGVTTGVGGGVMRDVLAGRTPQLLRRDIYAVAALLPVPPFSAASRRHAFGRCTDCPHPPRRPVPPVEPARSLARWQSPRKTLKEVRHA